VILSPDGMVVTGQGHDSTEVLGISHSHSQDPGDVPVRAGARVVLLLLLALAAAGTVFGLVRLWPSADPRVDGPENAFAAPGVTFEKAAVEVVQPPCKDPAAGGGSGGDPSGSDQGSAPACGQVEVTVLGGTSKGERVSVSVAPEVSVSGLRKGDTLEVMRIPPSEGAPASFGFFSVDRNLPLGIMAGIFVLVVALVARVRGILALLGLGFGGYVLVKFMLPALLTGESGLGVAVVGASAIMFVVLYLAHGLSIRTSAALAGTLAGVGISALIGLVAIDRTRLSGISDDTGALLSGFVGDLDFQGLLTCAVIVAGLGVLNDVTITQSSAVWELRGVAPGLGRLELYRRAMRIGRDHIASTIYTIVFAYAGAALSVLLLLYFYERPILSLISTEQIAEEIVRTLASGIGLVLAVPITTAIAALTVGDARSTGSPDQTADGDESRPGVSQPG
jgi:uncharacterized membrane protein